MAAVTIGLSAGIFLMAFYNGMVEQRVRQAIQNETSHIQIHHPEFRKDQELKFYLSDGATMINQVRGESFVKKATGRIIIPGMIASASGSSGITINAVVPKEETLVTGLQGKIITGNYFDTSKGNEVLIGEKQHLLALLK